MYKTVSIEIDSSHDELCSALLSMITAEMDELTPHLLEGMWQFHDRAEYVDDSLELVEVVHEKGNKYTLYYEYEWFAYLGCDDLNKGSRQKERVSFSVENSTVSFQFLKLERPAPADEL